MPSHIPHSLDRQDSLDVDNEKTLDQIPTLDTFLTTDHPEETLDLVFDLMQFEDNELMTYESNRYMRFEL